MFDVIIVGGSYAGVAAAIQLGRARRSVLIVDAGQRRNRSAQHAHGFLGQDGVDPGVIAERGLAEALAYPTVSQRQASVTGARVIPGGFLVEVAGEMLSAKRLILATGVVDELPPIPGVRERWGRTVFHCPYCHGYELNRGRVGIIATTPLSAHLAMLASEWGALGQGVFFLNGAFEPDAEQLNELAAREIAVEREPIIAVEGELPEVLVRLHSGRVERFVGLFLGSNTLLAGPFAEQLGCELEAGPVGSFYKTDMMKETTVPGVFACGDAGLPMGSLSFAVADGVRAGVAAHQSLVFRRG
ncbi:MAG TPA: NAD(P)/FAD-dependent oxidoreductase [Polyangiaceae bacterium]|nr:NAD(P)/FAD-dependent oxidoreductase [Polyangiaceae bacterium]